MGEKFGESRQDAEEINLPQETDGANETEHISKEEQGRIEFIKGLCGEVFDRHHSGVERVEEVLKNISPVIESKKSNLDKEEIVRQLNACIGLEDRQQFIDRVFEATKPVSDFRRNNPELNIEIMMENAGFTKINRSLYYGEGDNLIHIHLAPSEDLGMARVKKLMMEGFNNLAEIVNKNKKVEKITARSWIVGDHPKVMEKLGFKIDQESGEKVTDERGLGNEEKSSEISREDFLKRYLKEKE
jgi:hypothetical protein